MADAPRPRPVEYYNPRPLILGICFFWGIAVGFCLFYFAPPKQMGGTQSPDVEDAPAAPTMSVEEKRRLGTPEITSVTPAPDVPETPRLRFETLVVEPPFPTLTAEGGMTGRTAHVLRQRSGRRPPAQTDPQQRRPMTPPPIPELMP